MKLGNRIFILIISFFSFNSIFLLAEDKIISSTLINLEQIKPSFEELSEENENLSPSRNIKEKKNSKNIIGCGYKWSCSNGRINPLFV